MRWLQVSLSALFILGVNSKGGSDKGGANNVQQYSGGGGVVTSPAAFASAGAFGAVVLLTAGSRRRYGTYQMPTMFRCATCGPRKRCRAVA